MFTVDSSRSASALGAVIGRPLVNGPAGTLAAAVEVASQGKPTNGLRSTTMRIFQTEALIIYRLDESEHARRSVAASEQVPAAEVLELLLGLPIGMPVPVDSLTHRERAALRSAPDGFVDVEARQVIRQAVAPVAVDLALVGAKSWRRGLAAAGRFAPFCTRAMVLADYPGDLEELLVQAGFFGIGVIVSTERGTEVLVAPTPYRRVRFGAASWQFLEQVYRHR